MSFIVTESVENHIKTFNYIVYHERIRVIPNTYLLMPSLSHPKLFEEDYNYVDIYTHLCRYLCI